MQRTSKLEVSNFSKLTCQNLSTAPINCVRYAEQAVYHKMASRAALYGTGTGTAKHGTTGHSGTAVPCLIVPPCQDLGLGTALWPVRRAVPCR
jgi:hypothetical protein